MRAAANKLTLPGIAVIVLATITLLVGLVYAVNMDSNQTGPNSAAADMHYSLATTAPAHINMPQLVTATPPVSSPITSIRHVAVTTTTYRVHAGDTLSSIAAKLYGIAKYWPV